MTRKELQRVTWKYRQWLKEWVCLGGDPDASEAMYAKEQIAQAEERFADDAARLDYWEWRNDCPRRNRGTER